MPKKENVNPVELQDGRYAVEKPTDEHLTGVEYDSIETNPYHTNTTPKMDIIEF